MTGIFTGASHFTISGGTFCINYSHSNPIASTLAFEKLSTAAAHSALHDAPARTDESRCHQHTRTNILDHLQRWAQGMCDEGAPIFWLHGGAGAGKSAIMQTLAERCVAQRLALGSFFFSRSDTTRNTAEVLIPTLVYQLALRFPVSMDVLGPVIDQDPLIFKKSLDVQWLTLLIRPLQYLVQLNAISDAPQTPRVFLIDGLDECSGYGGLLGLEVSRTVSPFSELDALYDHILVSAAHRDQVLQIIAHCAFTELPSSTSFVCIILGCSLNDLIIYLADMTPLVAISQTQSRDFPHGVDEVRLLHASLGDFLRDRSRSGSLYVNEEAYLASKLEIHYQLLDPYSREASPQTNWLVYPGGKWSPPCYILSRQVANTVRKSGHLVITQEFLQRYSLYDLYQCQLRFKHSGKKFCQCSRPGNILRFLLTLRWVEDHHHVGLYRRFLDDFYTILDSELGLERTSLGPSILPLIFHGFSAATVGEILFYHCHNNPFYRLMSFQRSTDGVKPKTFLDFIPAKDFASIYYDVNTSTQRTTLAVEAILDYLFGEVNLHYSFTHSAHKSWMKRTKPGKHIATGAPRLASVLHARCARILCLLEKPADQGRLYKYRMTFSLRHLVTVLWPKRRHWVDWLRLRQEKTGMVVNLLHALLWLRPHAGFSHKIQIHSSSFPRNIYQRDPDLVGRVRRCLDEYKIRVRKSKLAELQQRIQNGDVDALIEKSGMLNLDGQD